MSTFNGIVKEFDRIRIDYFREMPNSKPPHAYLLSHVHADHIQGIENIKSAFIYCSAATRKIMLRLETRADRMNFNKRILEKRIIWFRGLEKLLKPVPLQTPVEIELYSGQKLRATLIDANHCPGAVMSLIEDMSKAILYTGDIRAEPWWVNSIAQDPVLFPYAIGLKSLDTVYLDTTYAAEEDRYAVFPTKAEGLRDLIMKMQRYPLDTRFHVNSWTYGYERVWAALSFAFRTELHIEDYRYKMYGSIASAGPGVTPLDGGVLAGFPGLRFGKQNHTGCLTRDKTARIHVCEYGSGCISPHSSRVVFIEPVVGTTTDGDDVLEAGAAAHHDLGFVELDLSGDDEVARLLQVVSQRLPQSEQRKSVLDFIKKAAASGSKRLRLDDEALRNVDEPSFELLIIVLERQAQLENTQSTHKSSHQQMNLGLPSRIRYHYARHSSYDELRGFVKIFQPHHIHPCTGDEGSWRDGNSMEVLFGDLCSGRQPLSTTVSAPATGKKPAVPTSPKKRCHHETNGYTEGLSDADETTDGETPENMYNRKSQTATPKRKKKSRTVTKRLKEPQGSAAHSLKGKTGKDQEHALVAEPSVEAIEVADDSDDDSGNDLVSPSSSEFCSDASEEGENASRARERVRARKEAYHAAVEGRWSSQVQLLSSSSWFDGDDEL